MDCECCGRYRPSQEIAPLRAIDGRLVMACARCRRLAAGRRGQTPPDDVRTTSFPLGPAAAISPR
jgi:hypothetical protein